MRVSLRFALLVVERALPIILYIIRVVECGEDNP